MSKIKNISAREILDSRGNPTIEAKVELANGLVAKARVPAGASTGRYEAYELRDNDKKRYRGLGVLKAIKNIEAKILPKLKGQSAVSQEKIDELMIKLDGSDDKKNLGANAILAVSLAVSRAGALVKGLELFAYLGELYGFNGRIDKMPVPCFNIFNGGKHADTNLDFQEFMVIPVRPGIKFSEMVRMGAEIFHELGRTLRQAGYDTDVGSEGGYAPDIISSIQAIELIIASIIRADYRPGEDIKLGIDVGASELYKGQDKKYIFRLDKASFTNSSLIGLYYEWFRKYPILYLEDGLAEDDWEGWRELTRELGEEIMLVGDDLFATNINRLRRGLKEKAANSIIIKLNQAGTLTETINCLKLARKHNYKIVISHRSGETADDFIADLAVATRADYIKAGSLSRSERLVKYNRLMEIEKIINL